MLCGFPTETLPITLRVAVSMNADRICVIHADQDIFTVAGDGNAMRILADFDILDQFIRRGIDDTDG